MDVRDIILILSIIIPIIGAISSLAVFFRLRSENRKLISESLNIEAEASDKISDAAIKLLKPYQDSVERLEKEVRITRDCFEDCKNKLSQLSIEISDLKLINTGLMNNNNELLKRNTELGIEVNSLKNTNELLRLRIVELESTVKALVTQLQSLGENPSYGRREDDMKGE